MFVKQNKTHKGILLTYTIGYRENGKVKHKNVETLGYLDELKKNTMIQLNILKIWQRKKVMMKLMN